MLCAFRDEFFGPWVRLSGPAEIIALPEAMPGLEDLDLRAAMGKLSGTQREVVELYYYAGYSVAEIADMLGKNESAVYSLHARALRALRDRMSEREDRRIYGRGRLISRISSEKPFGRKKIDG